MKIATASLIAVLAPAISGRFVETNEVDAVQLHPEDAELYHIELSPGETKWVTEEQKWELRRVSSLRLFGLPHCFDQL
jgi:bacterial leucyl aminopeptidase